MKFVLLALGALVALIVIIVVIGALLPRHHEVSRSLVVRASTADVYRTITDFAAAPSWRRDVKRVEVLDASRFREHGQHGAVTYEVKQQEPDRLLVTEIADKDLGYSGSWTYALADEGTGTRVTITEKGDVSNVLFRFMSRFVFGHTKTMDTYLAALAQRYEGSPRR
jgi:Polyketide cyclase / dehydrase and lipid transport